MIEIAASERGNADFRKRIEAQVDAVRRWWANEDLDSESRFAVVAPKRIHDVYHLRKFLDKHKLEESGPSDALVVYVTGHGVKRPSGDHFLLLRDSLEDRLPATAYLTGDLITRVLDSEADHVLVIVDSCYSGVLDMDLRRRFQALSEMRRQLSSLVVISTTNETGTPYPEQFTRFLEAVAAYFKRKEAGFAGSHLSFEDFYGAMKSVSRSMDAPDVQFVWPRDAVSSRREHQQPSPCLPNPGYLLQQTSDDYWLPHASGQLSSEDHDWHFTGRTGLLRRIIKFLESGSAGTLIVTGEAGSGKSALLGNVVTLSNPLFRSDAKYQSFIQTSPPDLLVRERAIDAAVLARNIGLDELAAELHVKLTGEPPVEDFAGSPVDQLLDHIQAAVDRGNRPLSIVIDGVDEARNPASIVRNLLQPLADLRTDDGRPAVRMLLGIRSSHAEVGDRLQPSQDSESDLLNLARRLTYADEPLRTDISTEADIAAYVSTLLTTVIASSESIEEPPLGRLDELAAMVAGEVAPSFLDARLAVEAVRTEGRLPEPADQDWWRVLRRGTRALLERDIDEVGRHLGESAETVRYVLKATALAQGTGLPWAGVWPCAVETLADHRIPNLRSLIGKVKESRLKGYLTTGVEDDRYVYRPIHESISKLLRGDPQKSREDHRRLAVAFSTLLEGAVNDVPHPYLRRHLVQHAAAGGVLNDQVVTEKALLYETSGNVRGALGLLSEHAPNTTRLFAWARIEPFLGDAPIPARAGSLRFSLWEPGSSQPPRVRSTDDQAVAELVPRWKNLAIRGNVLAQEELGVCSLVSFTLRDGTSLIAVGRVDGTVRLWDPATVTPVGRPVLGPGGSARTMAVVHGPQGGPLLAVGCDGGAWTCDPVTGENAVLPITVPVHDLVSFEAPDGAARLAIATSEGLVLCDPLAGSVLDVDAMHKSALAGPVKALAVTGQVGDRSLLAVQRDDAVEIRDSSSLDLLCTVPITGDQISALTLLGGRNGEALLALAMHVSGQIRFWDALTGTERQHCAIRRSAAVLAPYPELDAGTLLAVGADDGSVQLWDPKTGEEVCRFPADHTSAVTGLAVVPGLGGVSILISGSLDRDRTVRVWNPEAWARRTPRAAQRVDGQLLAVLPGRDTSAQVVSIGADRNLVITSAATCEEINSVPFPFAPADGSVTALATYTASDSSPMVFVGLPDRTVGCWNGEWRVMNAWTSAQDHATAFTAFTQGTRTVLVVGTSRGNIVYCDPVTGVVEEWTQGRGSGRPVRALAYLPSSSGGLLAAGTDFGVELRRPFRESHDRLPDGIGRVESLAVYPSGQEDEWLLVTGGADGMVRLWTPEAAEKERLTMSGSHDGPVSALGMVRSPGSRAFVVSTGRRDTTMRVWDADTGEEVQRLVTAASLTSVAVVPSPARVPNRQPLIFFGGPAGIAAVTAVLPQPEQQPVE